MKQSRTTSLFKSMASTATGFGISLAAQWLILPHLIGAPVPIEANISFALIMTALSVARGYVLERCFEALGWRIRLSPFLQAVIAERRAHLDREGWDDAHDDAHRTGELAEAGAMYALHAGTQSKTPPHEWPWADDWWKPTAFRRDLVKACALIVSEGDKFDRDRKRGRGK
ncbi:hypothetical protein [Bradyrhizobium sp. SZCCHNR1020]|uniref:DUF7220 family protein n=1 Tax=Bradyrhizobium sp. SZCCHNR1020 TaxID=3057343 RepID=UPI002915F8EA|nr:hypothetical protein [Bradyrhizobium sp. SZCCHNR1020]